MTSKAVLIPTKKIISNSTNMMRMMITAVKMKTKSMRCLLVTWTTNNSSRDKITTIMMMRKKRKMNKMNKMRMSKKMNKMRMKMMKK